MIYLDNGATSFHKPPQVAAAVQRAMATCANPGRGGYGAAAEAERVLYACRAAAGALFSWKPEGVVLTTSCTHGLNLAIRSCFRPGSRVVVTGWEHNAVIRPLHALGARILVAGRRLFDWSDTLEEFHRCLKEADGAVFTQVSNVFGYILPLEEMAALCRERGIPFVIDAAQGAGSLEVNMEALGADFIAMPGHKGLLGPQGTGLLLCREGGDPLLYGGTGSASIPRTMPEELPERLEAGTLNVPGFAGLTQGLKVLKRVGVSTVFDRERRQLEKTVRGLKKLGMEVFSGPHQGGTLSFRCGLDSEEAARRLAQMGVAVRAGLHCAPLAHESAGTLDTGTIRISFGWEANDSQTEGFLRSATKLPPIPQ